MTTFGNGYSLHLDSNDFSLPLADPKEDQKQIIRVQIRVDIIFSRHWDWLIARWQSPDTQDLMYHHVPWAWLCTPVYHLHLTGYTLFFRRSREDEDPLPMIKRLSLCWCPPRVVYTARLDMVFAISRLPKFSKSATIYKEAAKKTLCHLANWLGPRIMV